MRFLVIIAFIFCCLQVTFSAAQNVDSLKEVANSMEPSVEKVDFLCTQSEQLEMLENETAKLFSTQALEIATEIGYVKGIISSNYHLGQAHYRVSDYDKALPYFLKSLELSEEIQDEEWIAHSLCSIGLIDNHRGEHESAIKYLKKALELSERLEDDELNGRLANVLGVVFWEIENYQEALNYFTQALEIELATAKDSSRIHIGYNNLGITNYHLGAYDTAIVHLRKAIIMSQRFEDHLNTALGLNNLGKVHTALGKYQIADSLLNSARQITLQFDNKRIKVFNLTDLIELYQTTGDFEQAFNFQTELMALQDSMFNESKDQQMSALTAQYDAEKKDREILKQQLDLERQQRNQNVYLAIVLFLVIFLASSIYFIRKLRASNLKLEQNRKILSSRNNKLEQTMDELVATQDHLVHSEKMATLGTLFAGIAHEINTPLGAIKSSAEEMITRYGDGLDQIKISMRDLTNNEFDIFFKLIQEGIRFDAFLSSLEERKLYDNIYNQLQSLNLKQIDKIASRLTNIGVSDHLADYLPLLQNPKAPSILRAVEQISTQGRLSRNVLNAANKTNRIIYAMRTYSFKGESSLVDTNIKETIDTALILYDNRLKKGVETTKSYDESPLYISCYPDEITQVWVNLIHNALDAMEADGKLDIQINSQPADTIKISISDNGTGISDDFHHKIFDPFFTTKAKGEGTGLGLDIVRRIVEKHDGKIEFEANTPKGTTFNVYLKKNFRKAS